MLLARDNEHKKVFPNVLVIGFCYGKSLKDYLARAAFPKTNETRRYEPSGRKNGLVCDSCNSVTVRTTTTFTLETCKETFKTQSGL